MWCKYLSLLSCKRCYSDAKIHQGQGYCTGCYSFFRRRKNKKILERQFDWSINYQQCVECRTESSPHQARGLCKKCSGRNYARKKIGFVHQKWSRHYSNCIECNSIENLYSSKGMCTKCYSKYRYKNPDYLRKKAEYHKRKSAEDIQFKLRSRLRSRLRMAITSKQKKGSAIRDLGCSVPELKIYLESKFQSGMNWDNWSRNGWHIDHIIPLDSFDLTKQEELKRAVHYTNLQPLWAKENISKSNKIQDLLGVPRH